jgi:hypothetical protein
MYFRVKKHFKKQPQSHLQNKHGLALKNLNRLS